MSGTYEQCPQCGAVMSQTGGDSSFARYKCPACGYMKSVALTDGGNLEYIQRKSDILSRVRIGIVDWKITSWDNLQREILDFVSRYEEAGNDIQMQISVIACITNGFQMMDAEKYKQCKVIFKITEKMYKQKLKMLKKQADTKLYESVNDYKDYRAKYKKCRNNYRNTKLAWKAVFFVFKKVAFH